MNADIIRKIVTGSIFCIILLIGVIVGLLIFSPQKISINNNKEQIFVIEREQTAAPVYNALDPVSGDWGITANELLSRINLTFEKMGIRGRRINKWRFSECGKEFRHAFSSELLMLGELSEADNVRRVAIFYDPALDMMDSQLNTSLIRALKTAIDPSLTREDISNMMNSMKISSQKYFYTGETEFRHNGFIFKVLPVAGSSFVFTATLEH